MLGLSEPHIAHQDIVTNKELNKQLGTVFLEDGPDISVNKDPMTTAHQKIDLEYVLSKQPTIIFVGDPAVLKKHGYKKFQLVTDYFDVTFWAKNNPFHHIKIETLKLVLE